MIETSWHSYPKVWALGHAALSELLNGPYHIEEKIDGSQFSFGIFDKVIKCRSKGIELNMEAPEKMFEPACETVLEIEPWLKDGYTYRAEFLSIPKHNVIEYERTPAKKLILFDVNPGYEKYLSYEEKLKIGEELGLEVVPQFQVSLTNIDELNAVLERKSCLGKANIEGIVIKNYTQFGSDKKVLMGKYVSGSFKETHKTEFRSNNPMSADILTILCQKYKTEARWAKTVQHLKEAGELTDSPKDIGKLIVECKKDVLAECQEMIKEDLFKWAWPRIERGLVARLPEWYKEELAKKQFSEIKK